MRPERHPGCNFVLSAPQDEDGNPLPFFEELPVILGEAGFVSYWRPSRSEIDAIARGAPIKLYVISNVHPPVLLEVGNP